MMINFSDSEYADVVLLSEDSRRLLTVPDRLNDSVGVLGIYFASRNTKCHKTEMAPNRTLFLNARSWAE